MAGVIGTPWRHAWAMGGLAMDVGIHFAYVMESLLGPIETVYGRCRQVLAKRLWGAPGEEPAWADVECPDVFGATLAFESGAQGAWVMHFAGAGEGQWRRTIQGTDGAADGPGDRSGGPVRIVRGTETPSGDALLAALPGYALNEVETRLFGERPVGYSFEGPITDRKLLAAETADFLAAVRGEHPPESPAEVGIRAVAVIHALLESCLTGRPVRVADVLAGEARAAEARIEGASLALT
jgi:predicted dehydrogenase